MTYLFALWQFVRHLLSHHFKLLLGLLLGFLLPWALFLKIAQEVWEGDGFPGDQATLALLHTHATPALDALALGLSRAGGPIGASAVAVALMLGLLLARQRRALAFFALAVGGAQLLNLAAKYLLARVRPSLWVSLAPETTYSFPSGHAMAAAALAAALAFLLWHTRWRGPAVAAGLLWAGGMGWSRVYLGVHFPSDVLAGWVGSVGWVGGVHLLFTRYFQELQRVWSEAGQYWHGARKPGV